MIKSFSALFDDYHTQCLMFSLFKFYFLLAPLKSDQEMQICLLSRREDCKHNNKEPKVMKRAVQWMSKMCYTIGKIKNYKRFVLWFVVIEVMNQNWMHGEQTDIIKSTENLIWRIINDEFIQKLKRHRKQYSNEVRKHSQIKSWELCLRTIKLP